MELCRRLEALLQGKRDRLDLVRKYPGQPNRLGVIATAASCAGGKRLRLSVAERLSFDVLRFVEAKPVGGPVRQTARADGSVLECQTFPTRYPTLWSRDRTAIGRTSRSPKRSPGVCFAFRTRTAIARSASCWRSGDSRSSYWACSGRTIVPPGSSAGASVDCGVSPFVEVWAAGALWNFQNESKAYQIKM